MILPITRRIVGLKAMNETEHEIKKYIEWYNTQCIHNFFDRH